MLTIHNLSKKYGHKTVLSHINLTLEPYSIYGVLGHNGCGKSTLFKSLMGLISISEGKIEIEGKALSLDEQKSFGYMPEQKSLLPDLLMREHIELMGKLKGMRDDEIETQTTQLIQEFGLKQHEHKRIRALSKGQQQKVQLMIALINDPKLLILDEPLNGLDIESVDFFIRILKSFSQKGKAILISSHQMEFMDALCTHVLLLKNGQSIFQGPITTIQDSFGFTLQLNREMANSLEGYTFETVGQHLKLSLSSQQIAIKIIQSILKHKELKYLKLSSKSIPEIMKENP
jgi:ABC-2 type transport system ATP-binding protein